MLGDWDSAERELIQAAESDGLADNDYVTCPWGVLAGLRGDIATADTMLAALGDLRASEDLQEKSMVSLAEAFAAAARRDPQDALRHAREALDHADAIGISFEALRWAWPLAARTAHELGNTAGTRDLLGLLDSYQPGHLAPMQKAERDLVRVRLAASDGDPAAGASFAAAVTGLRKHSTPYHLAHGLLDHAQYLTRLGDSEAAEAAISKVRDIARRLRCQPLINRAADLTHATIPGTALDRGVADPGESPGGPKTRSSGRSALPSRRRPDPPRARILPAGAPGPPAQETRTSTCNALAACLSRVPRRVARTVLRGPPGNPRVQAN